MKRLLPILTLIFLVSVSVFAESGNDLIFKTAGGGKFIYCNNPEELVRADLADNSESPEYLMSNRGLEADNYRLYITHFNRVTKENADGDEYPGEDIYFDAVFTAKSECTIVLKRTAFEIPADITEYLNYETIKTEDTWSGLYACADLIGKPIYTLHSDKVFEPSRQTVQTVTLARGERMFLSDYIKNYSAVPYPKHVLMAADFTLENGVIDVDVFAASERTAGDCGAEYPGVDFENCAFGTYKHDGTYKGVADSMPEVCTELEYTVDDANTDGSFLPVTVYNRLNPEGMTVTRWTGNLNPQDDTYARHLVVENDILPLYYPDKSKLGYYGENVAEKDKNDVWVFDTAHSDTSWYDSAYGIAEDEYTPNFELRTDENNIGMACSLGNYGVSVGYKLKITNNGTRKRFLDYCVTTAANVIVEVTDSDGKDLQPTISKGQTAEQTEEVMASVELPAGETTEFVIKMTLPVQNYGGQRQAFRLSSEKSELEFGGRDMIKPSLIEKSPTKLYGIDNLLKKSDEKTRNIFEGCIDDYDIVKTADGFAAYNKTVSSNPYYYGYYWKITGRVFLLDDEFNVKKEIYLGSQPIEMTYAAGMLYVKTIANGSFAIDADGNADAFDSYILPRETAEGVICAKNGELLYSADGDKYYAISFQSKKPPFADLAEKAGDKRFYYGVDGTYGVSADGIYWTECDGKVSADDIFACEIAKNAVKVRVNDEVLSFDTPPVILDGVTLVPLRFITEKLGMRLIYDDGKIIAYGENGLIELAVGSDEASVNGEIVKIDVSACIIDGRCFVPLRFLGERLGLAVSWNETTHFAEAEGNVGSPVGEIELCGDISAKVVEKSDTKPTDAVISEN